MVILSWLFLTINILLALLVFFLTLAFFTGAPFIPTPKRIVVEMVKLADIKASDTVVDLGSGDGRLLVSAALAGAKTIGWEINPFLVFLARVRAYSAGVSDKVRVYWGDYRQASLTGATVVLLFAITGHMAAIERKLRQELKPGSRVISYIFSFPQVKYYKKTDSGIYCYFF